MRPTGVPSRQARKYSASACSKNGFFSRSRCFFRSEISGGTHMGSLRYSRQGRRMNRMSSPRERTGRTSIGTARHLSAMAERTISDVFEKARTHDRLEELAAARQQDVLPYFRLLEGQAGPVVRMEGAERIMLGSNNYLGLTRDPRVIKGARDALDTYGTALTGSRLLNGTLPMHVEL